jgi:hypothetical protein
LACAVATNPQQEVNGKYRKKAGELDLKQGTAPGGTGPFRKELNEYGQKGRVIASVGLFSVRTFFPVAEAFAEMFPGTLVIADLYSSALANEHSYGHCLFFADKPSEAKGRFTQRLYGPLGLAAHLSWARLLADRYRDLAEVPAPTREDPGGDRHHFNPGDESAPEYANYHSPDHIH